MAFNLGDVLMKLFYLLLLLTVRLEAAEVNEKSPQILYAYESLKLQGNLLLELTNLREEKIVLTVSTQKPPLALSDLKGLESSKDIDQADELRVTNAQLGILAIPRFINPFIKLSVLHLNNCGITDLPDKVFMGLAAVISINLANNHIKALGPATFEGLPNVEHINLSFNQLHVRNVSLETFNSCPTLKCLYLDYNTWTENVRDRHLIEKKLKEVLTKGKDLTVSVKFTHKH